MEYIIVWDDYRGRDHDDDDVIREHERNKSIQS